MTQNATEVLVAARLSELCRQACAYAGLPTRGTSPSGDRFVVRSGPEPAELVVKLLQEALAEEAPEIASLAGDVDPGTQPAGQVTVREGFDSPCPIARDLEQVLGPGRPLTFAVEQHDPAGRLLSRTWVVLSEELPLPEVPLTAAVTRETYSCGGDSSGGIRPGGGQAAPQLPNGPSDLAECAG
jgi:hypothetical protein